ncbi:ABC transporter ATP-binding protein [Mycobacterium sp. NAZ190054]|uniref:ABC transporter ATP-binding protein n=1 Tax=Mycobacterium sp. NAZ190054 TaxID=1747766 RepID=UPI00079AB696|nr:ABC transporter ATP-binding protein [Mycobacterium sp. NAZ190054]KWX69062.1 Fe3+/spermidine/putrescine ABC transporter ATP-binding protein [Mycobacterium sp. NAZ190054]
MLELDGLCKAFADDSKYGRVRAVDEVSFTVRQGEFFTMLGPSGCGKTTTLRCIAGLESPDSGRISVDDTVLYSGASGVSVPANRRNLGMVFQSYAIWPHMNVFDNVAFPLRVGVRRRTAKKETKERVERCLEVVGLGHLAGRFATKLSGGQQQRLALARALVIEPAVLLLDEPLSNLDAKLRESLRFELKRLQRDQGITTVYVTHDQSEALSMSNQIAVMRDGRISQIGTPFEVYLQPTNDFVADFVGLTNFIDGVVTDVSGSGGTVRTENGELTVETLIEVGEGDKCVVSVRPEQIEVIQQDSARAGSNVLDGTVANRLFTGEAMDYQVSVGSTTLRCRTGASQRLGTGKPVQLVLPPQHCIALRRNVVTDKDGATV